MEILIAIIAVALAYAISWAICVGILYLICLCFSWSFSVLPATGVWLILCLVKMIWPGNKKKF